jgi:hypothetical protein
VESIEESLDNMVSSKIYFGRDTTGIGYNRRNMPEYDNVADVIRIVPENGSNETVLFLAGCHPVITDPTVDNFTLNANFPGYARELLEKENNLKNSLFLQACAGDINPKDNFKESGRKLADDVNRILKGENKSIEGSISYFIDTISISVTPWSSNEIEIFRKSSETDLEDMINRRNIRWSDLILGQYRENRLQTEMPVYVQTLNVGNWKLVGLSREVTTEFGIAIRESRPGETISVLGYTNDVASYLATDPHINAKNYEGYDSFFWYGQPTNFPLKTFDVIIQKIKETNR